MRKPTVIQINSTCGIGSTGKIATSISETLSKKNVENYILYSSSTNGYSLGISCCTPLYTKVQAIKSHLLGNYGFNSHVETYKMISEIDKIAPDVVLLHNIHGHDCNLKMLFSYLKESHIKIIWTFHDCWAFTGYCTHFTFVQCEKWKTGCTNCPQRKQVSVVFDHSETLYKRKEELLYGLDMTIITPSHWLAGVVKQSFLKEYPIKVIHNGIDLNVFQPTESIFRQKFQINDEQFILLGVSFDWGKKKGLDVFVELSNRLDPNRYKIVLVGTDDKMDKLLPRDIISVHRTNNQKELAEIYSAADIFINPTREDTFPTVNIEALACGLPVVTFDVGGSPESIGEKCGAVVPVDDLDALERIIVKSAEEHIFNTKACISQAKQFDKDLCFQGYISALLEDKIAE